MNFKKSYNMKLLFTTIFRRTFLLACFLSIIYHYFYFDIYDLSYILIIKIVLLIIAAIEFVGMIMYFKDSPLIVKHHSPLLHFSLHRLFLHLFYLLHLFLLHLLILLRKRIKLINGDMIQKNLILFLILKFFFFF